MEGLSLRRVAVGIGGLKALRTALSIATLILSAGYFGASLERDAWVAAQALLMAAAQFIFGPLNEVLRSHFIHHQEKSGEVAAFRAAGGLLVALVVTCGVVVALSWVGADLLASGLGAGFDARGQQEIARMIRWTLPALVPLVLTQFWLALLNARANFYSAEIVGVATAGLQVLALVALAPRWGVLALVFSQWVSLLVLAVVQGLQLRGQRGFCWGAWPVWLDLRAIGRAALPFYGPYGLTQAASLLERALCSSAGVGAMSILDYARRFIELPSGVFQAVLNAVYAPVLASHFSKKQLARAAEESRKFLRFSLALAIPGSLLIGVFSEVWVGLLLHHGRFPAEWLEPTARVLSAYAPGLVGVVMYSTAIQSLVAEGRFVSAARAAMGVYLGSLLLMLGGFASMGLIGIPLSWTAAHLAGGLFLSRRPSYR